MHLELTRQSLNPHEVRALFKVTVTRQQFEVFEFCEITGKESINAVETIWDWKQYAQKIRNIMHNTVGWMLKQTSSASFYF